MSHDARDTHLSQGARDFVHRLICRGADASRCKMPVLEYRTGVSWSRMPIIESWMPYMLNLCKFVVVQDADPVEPEELAAAVSR
jgi:hypothetical protein